MRAVPGVGYPAHLKPPNRDTRLGGNPLRTSRKATNHTSRSRVLLAVFRNSRRACLAILVAWILIRHIVGLTPLPSWHEHAAASGSFARIWKHDENHSAARLGTAISPVATRGDICVHLAGVRPGGDGAAPLHKGPWGRVRANFEQGGASFSLAATPSLDSRVLVVLVATIDGSGGDDHFISDRPTSGETRRHIFSNLAAKACAQVVESAHTLRSSQTLGEFDVEVLLIDRGGSVQDAFAWPSEHMCAGMRRFDIASRIATDARDRRVARGLVGPTGLPQDFIVFVDAAEHGARAQLHATMLEKMVLGARGRRADLVSIQPAGNQAVDVSVNDVCIGRPEDGRGRPACRKKGAPVLLRVPVWLSTAQLAGWVGAVVEIIAAASAHADDGGARWDLSNADSPTSDGLAALFCAGGNDAVGAHSLREDQLFCPGPVLTQHARPNNPLPLNGPSAPNTCASVQRLHPRLHTSRAAFSAAYEVQSRDQGLTVPHVSFRLDDKAAAARADRGGVISYQSATSPSQQQRLQRPNPMRPAHVASALPAQPGFMLIVPWLEHGGADQFNVNLARALTKLSIRVVVVTTLSSAHPTARDFYASTPDVFHLPHLIASPRDTSGVVDVLTHLTVSRQVQVVMISHSALGYKLLSHLRIALMAMRHGHVSFVDFVHLEEMEWGDGGYAAMSVAHVQHLDRTFAASQHVAAWMRKRIRQLQALTQSTPRQATGGRASHEETFWSDDDRIRVAYIGVNTHALRPLTPHERASERSDLLRPLGPPLISAETPVIAYIARMVDQKLPGLYFEILRQLREERRMDFVSVAIGDGPKLAELRANISQHPLLSRMVLTLGMLNHTATTRALAAADVLLLPSQNEGVSLAVYEAMALGVTPVVSAVGGQCELVAGGAGACIPLDLGAAADAADPGQISAAAKPFVDELARMLMTREVMAASSRVARHRVEQEFGIADTMRALRRGLCR